MQRLVRTLPACVAAALFVAHACSGMAATTWPPAATPPQINVTSDSAPGWLPSQEQIAGVRKTAEDFLAALDGGRSVEAYALLADGERRVEPFPAFSDGISKFNLQAGAVSERRIVTVTWTKDPAQAPAPGVYAALDIVSRFANIDRHCGYLVLYQSPSGGPFRVMRQESNFIDNAMALDIEHRHSRAEVDLVWSRLSAHCPNYPAESQPPLPEQPQASVGYPTVAAALQGLHARAGVVFSSPAGWTIAHDDAASTVWSFVPSGDPAYPAVVKRQIVQTKAGVEVKMDVHCEASKAACDNLVRQFEQLNAHMEAAIARK